MNHLATLRQYATLLPEDETDVLKAIEAILKASKNTRPCLFLLPDDVNNMEFLDFANARRGVWEMWGVVEGDTMGIVTEDGGRVYAVMPNFVKMLEGVV